MNGAKPGIVMQGNPQVGIPYRQEYQKDTAQDMAEVLSLDETATVAYGTFDHCLKTKDWSPLEPGIVENKYFAPGVGQILAETVQGGSDREELIDITTE